MPRRGPRTSVLPRSTGSNSKSADQAARASAGLAGDDVPDGARRGELVRRIALGLLAALLMARPYWPSEIDPSRVAGSGLLWVLSLLLVAGLWIAGSLLSGRFQFRWSWTDLAVVSLVGLVGLSTPRALDRRLAINLAWEWAGLGCAYVLARNLPRTRGESTVLAGALVATAAAISTYGLYQARVEIPQLQERFRRSPEVVLREANVPAEPQQVQVFTDRLLGSNEVFATFGLANSLAGFLVGPLAAALGMVLLNLAQPLARGSRWGAVALAIPPVLCLLTCLLLTKSRSAYLGLAVACAVLAWKARRQVPRRLFLGTGLAAVVLAGLMVVAGLAAGRLDRAVLTQSPMSLRYRWEYWQGAWGVITEGASTLKQMLSSSNFWAGVGPGNFGSHYLQHKLPQSSEEIQDPHNLFLEVWATAGFWAFLALVACLALAFWNLLIGTEDHDESRAPRPRGAARVPRETTGSEHAPASTATPQETERLGWLVTASGLGLVMVLIVGEMNLFQRDLLPRWLVLAAGWVMAVLLGRGLWRRVALPGYVLGAGALAVVVDLLAAGGISFTGVALALWLLIALGLNLREDRGCGAVRTIQSRIPGFALSIVWAALVGSFAGAIVPHWRCEAALARADDALRRLPPDFEAAQAAYEFAKRTDRFSSRPWLGEAFLQLMVWQSHGSRPADLRWKTIPALLVKAAAPPRNPAAWTLHSERAKITRSLLAKVAPSLSPRETIALQASIVEATRTASRIHPTSATLHARLAEASAEISMFQDAANEAREALRLDELLGAYGHRDKQLPPDTRQRLTEKLPEWTEKGERLKLNVN